MGTIISRVLLQEDSKKYAKVALSGYVNPNPASGVGLLLTKCIKLFKGPKGHSKMITNLAVGQFAKKIKNRKTPLDWLSFNENNVKTYIHDSLSGVEFTLASYVTLFSLLKRMGKAKLYKNTNKELPFLLIGGKEDPCTGYDKGRKASLANLKKAGFKDIDVITLENMRHEILNENDKEKVYEDILNFFNK
jgi:alpha-beta hydrolase superfamily lysophospholipase